MMCGSNPMTLRLAAFLAGLGLGVAIGLVVRDYVRWRREEL